MSNEVLLRRQFLMEVQAGVPVSRLIQKFGWSKTAAYDLVRRAKMEGIDDAVLDRTRRPHSSPRQLSADIDGMILSAKAQAPVATWGARKIQWMLGTAGVDVSIASVHRRLLMSNQVTPHRRRRFRSVNPVYTDAAYPNHVFCCDFKGLTSVTKTEAFNVVDDYSRYWLVAEPYAKKTGDYIRHSLERVFVKHGLPEFMRFDRGPPWASATQHHFTRLSTWLVACGVMIEIANSGCDNSHVERLHLTIENEIERGLDVKDTKERYNIGRRIYNEERPHDSLANKTPAEVYVPSRTPYRGERNSDVFADECDHMAKVRKGQINIPNIGRFYVGEMFNDRFLGVVAIDDHEWAIRFFEYEVTTLNLAHLIAPPKNKIRPDPTTRQRQMRLHESRMRQNGLLDAAFYSLSG